MPQEYLAHAQAIARELLGLSDAERAAHLEQACGLNHKLREHVERLLADTLALSAGDARAPGTDPLSADRSTTGPELPETRSLPRPASSLDPQVDPERMLGKYRVLRRLGVGGFGEVYLAERSDATRQLVAVKVLRGALTSVNVRQLEAEMRTLAALSGHPHIVALMDVGATEAGLPFLVMEYVAGVAGKPAAHLDDHCRQEHLNLGERLRLFLQACSAVEFSHRRLVIHRDIKPSNILVSGEGVAKLADFGIAKLLDRDNEETQTAPDRHAMTLYYASPEQLEGAPLDVTSDIYSLGVVLYQLLMGELPYRLPGRPNPAALARTIREQEPSKLTDRARSARSSDAGDTAVGETTEQPGAVQGLDLRQLSRQTLGDLDAIVLKALRADASERYGSAGELRSDLERFLAGEPVLARPVSSYDRVRRWMRRRPAITALATVSLALFVALVAGGAIYLFQTRRLLAEITRERNNKDQYLGVAKQTADRYLAEMREDPRLVAQGLDPLHRQLLIDARELYQLMALERGESNELRQARCESNLALAIIAAEFNDYVEASRLADAALSEVPVESPTSDAARRRQSLRGAALRNKGYFQLLAGQYDEARKAQREAGEIFSTLFASDPSESALLELAISQTYLGEVDLSLERLEPALVAFVAARDSFERLEREFPVRAASDPIRGKREYYRGMNEFNLGLSLLRPENYDACESSLRASQARLAKLVEANPDVPKYRDRLGRSLVNLSVLHARRGQHDESRAESERALKIFREITERNPHVREYAVDFLGACDNLGLALFRAGRDAELEALLPELKSLAERLESPNMGLRELDTLMNHYHVWQHISHKRNRPAEAQRAATKAFEFSTRLPDAWYSNGSRWSLRGSCELNYSEYVSDKEERRKLLFAALESFRHAVDLGKREESLTKNINITIERLAAQDEQAPDHLASAEARLQGAELLGKLVKSDDLELLRHRLNAAGSFCNAAHQRRRDGDCVSATSLYDRAASVLAELESVPQQFRPTRRQFLRNTLTGRAQANDQLRRYEQAERDWRAAAEFESAPEQTIIVSRAIRSRMARGDVEAGFQELSELAETASQFGPLQADALETLCIALTRPVDTGSSQQSDELRTTMRERARAYALRLKELGLFADADAKQEFYARPAVAAARRDSELAALFADLD